MLVHESPKETTATYKQIWVNLFCSSHLWPFSKYVNLWYIVLNSHRESRHKIQLKVTFKSKVTLSILENQYCI